MDEQSTSTPQLPGAFSLFKPSAHALLLNVWTFLALVLLPVGVFGAISIVGGAAIGTTENDALRVANFVFAIAATVLVSLVLGPALTYTELQSVRGKKITFEEAARMGMKHWWRFLRLTVLTGLAIALGCLALLVPGVFMMKNYLLAPYYLFDHDDDAFALMKRSRTDAKQFAGAIWGILGVGLLIGLVGIVPILIPVALILQFAYYCAPAVRYEQIQQAKKAVETAHPVKEPQTA